MMDSSPRFVSLEAPAEVAVITVTYNSESHIENLIASLRKPLILAR